LRRYSDDFNITLMQRVDHHLEAIAHHEAGHAVIAIEFGWQVDEVRISTSEGGITRFRYGDRRDDTARICISMAGWLAEEKFCGSNSNSFSGEDIFKHFQALCRGEQEANRIHPMALNEITTSDLRQIAMELYDDDTTHYSIVAAVAHYREATNKLLNTPRIWADVTKVAKALLRRRRLGPDAIKECLGIQVEAPIGSGFNHDRNERNVEQLVDSYVEPF
jgi:hypothetical protein